jgi:hypothetical protein
MTLIAWNVTGPILKNGAIGTEQECCCGDGPPPLIPCATCSTLTTDCEVVDTGGLPPGECSGSQSIDTGCGCVFYIESCGSQGFREIVPEAYHDCSCASVTSICQRSVTNGVSSGNGNCSCQATRTYDKYRDFMFVFNPETCQWEYLLEYGGATFSNCGGETPECPCPEPVYCEPDDCSLVTFLGCECNEFP